MMIKDVEELEIYRDSLELLEKLYLFLGQLSRAKYDTIDQIKRAAKSVPANIAEGFGKKIYPKEFKRFLMIAMGSSDECIAHLRILHVIVPKYRQEITILGESFKILSKRINKLRTSWFAG